MSPRIPVTRTRYLYLSFPALAVILLLLNALVACGSSPASSPPFPQNTFSLLKVPAPYVLPGQIIAGPDGNLWFPAIAYRNFSTTRPGGAIGRLTPGGKITLFPLPTPNTYPTAITFTRDGKLWFLAFQGNGQMAPIGDTAPRFTGVVPKVGDMTSDGHFRFVSSLPASISPTAIATGSDGNIWLAENNNTSRTTGIARMTPDGAFTSFPLPVLSQSDYLHLLIPGPDGNLWFSLESSDLHTSTASIGKISTQGKIGLYALGKDTGLGLPEDMAVGPDHNIWFTTFPSIGRITPTGQISQFNPDPDKKPYMQIAPAGITTGPDNNLWFATASEAAGRLTPSGTFKFYPFPSNSFFDNGGSSLTLGQLKGIVTAPDRTLWLTDGVQLGHFS